MLPVLLLWGVGGLVFKWVSACLPPASVSVDLELQLLVDVAAGVVAIGALLSARHHHAPSQHGGVALGGYVPPNAIAWLIRYFASWAAPLLALHVAAALLVGVLEIGSLRFDHCLDLALRVAADGVVVIALATATTAAHARWVGDVLIAITVVALWRSHLLFPLASAPRAAGAVFGDIPAASLADKGLHATGWGPVVAALFAAAALLAFWSRCAAPRSTARRSSS